MAGQVATPEVLCDVLAPDAGCVQKKSTKSGKWKSVFLLANVDLWWIDARDTEACPRDARAWHKGHCIGLVRGQTTVDYTMGGSQWVVTFKGDSREFRAESKELAAQWVAALQHRVCSWADLLRGDAERSYTRKGRLT